MLAFYKLHRERERSSRKTCCLRYVIMLPFAFVKFSQYSVKENENNRKEKLAAYSLQAANRSGMCYLASRTSKHALESTVWNKKKTSERVIFVHRTYGIHSYVRRSVRHSLTPKHSFGEFFLTLYHSRNSIMCRLCVCSISHEYV